MSEVKRYEMKTTYRGHESWDSLEEDKDGGYVNYEDYVALEQKLIDMAVQLSNAERKCRGLAEENAGLNKFIVQSCYVFNGEQDEISDAYICATDGGMPQTPATDAFLAEVKAEARKEGAYFVSNRMLAAWIAGFIDDTAKNAADIARMIITSTEFMDDAPDGDFDRSFSDSVLEDIINQLRKGVDQK